MEELNLDARRNYYLKKVKSNHAKNFALFFSIWATLTLAGIIAIVFCKIDTEKQRAYLIEHPLDTNIVEEELEDVFMTNGVRCLTWESFDEDAWYDVAANGFYYRCHYHISGGWTKLYWKYMNYVQINYVED